MSKVLTFKTLSAIWNFFFLWNDEKENRPHIHVGRANGKHYAKIWLEPEISVAKSGEMSDAELKQVLKIVKETRKELLESWAKLKRGEEIKTIHKKVNKKKL